MTKVKKIVVLGAVGAGKSAFLQKLTDDSVSTKDSPTIGLRIYSLALAVSGIEKIVFWELTNAGSLKMQPIDYLKGAHAGIYFFDLSRPSTYEVLQSELELLSEMMPGLPVIVLGNKSDLMKDEELKKITSITKTPFISTSAKNEKGLKELFNQLISVLA